MKLLDSDSSTLNYFFATCCCISWLVLVDEYDSSTVKQGRSLPLFLE